VVDNSNARIEGLLQSSKDLSRSIMMNILKSIQNDQNDYLKKILSTSICVPLSKCVRHHAFFREKITQ
jgi:Mg2+ and Co2+ transporter CorA